MCEQSPRSLGDSLVVSDVNAGPPVQMTCRLAREEATELAAMVPSPCWEDEMACRIRTVHRRLCERYRLPNCASFDDAELLSLIEDEMRTRLEECQIEMDDCNYR